MAPSRILACNACSEYVEIFEVPVEFTDPDRFVCLRCLDERQAPAPPQLELLEAPAPLRRETLSYNPQQAQIPF